ncbi:MAG: type II toxin-antitoxin system VapC family toxin [Bacteroidota bacterium]
MRLLLDTHTFLWFIGGDRRLSEPAKRLILDPENERLLSVASLWGMAIKSRLGRLELALPFSALVEEQVRGNAIDVLPIRASHLDSVAQLPFHHKDPFDRLIVAQAMAEEIPVLSRDGAFSDYEIEVLWQKP